VAGPEYARLNTGVSITRGNSGNGALPIPESEQGENKNNAGQITDARPSPPLFGNDRLHTSDMWAFWQTQFRDDNESRLTSLPARQLYRLSSVATAQRHGTAEPPRRIESLP
jgi:hypothetical protein